MTEREMAAVLLAYANGAVVQYKSHYRSTAKWKTMGIAIWQFSDYDYRVRPKPREWWMVLGIYKAHVTLHASQETATSCVNEEEFPDDYSVIHVREVPEDEP